MIIVSNAALIMLYSMQGFFATIHYNLLKGCLNNKLVVNRNIFRYSKGQEGRHELTM